MKTVTSMMAKIKILKVIVMKTQELRVAIKCYH